MARVRSGKLVNWFGPKAHPRLTYWFMNGGQAPLAEIGYCFLVLNIINRQSEIANWQWLYHLRFFMQEPHQLGDRTDVSPDDSP